VSTISVWSFAEVTNNPATFRFASPTATQTILQEQILVGPRDDMQYIQKVLEGLVSSIHAHLHIHSLLEYPKTLERRGHRRVDVLIGSGHLVAAQHAGERSHRSAADSDSVIMHFGDGVDSFASWVRTPPACRSH